MNSHMGAFTGFYNPSLSEGGKEVGFCIAK
jgi:hypothetical protein